MRAALTVIESGPGISPRSVEIELRSGKSKAELDPGAITVQPTRPAPLCTSYTKRSTGAPPALRFEAKPLPSQVVFGAGVVNTGTCTNGSSWSGSLVYVAEARPTTERGVLPAWPVTARAVAM